MHPPNPKPQKNNKHNPKHPPPIIITPKNSPPTIIKSTTTVQYDVNRTVKFMKEY